MNTPDTSFYMNLGFGFTFVTLALYVASIYIRNKNLRQDMETLEGLEEEQPTKKK